MSMNCTSSANHADVATTSVSGPPVAFGLAVKTTRAQSRRFFSIAGATVNDIMNVGMDITTSTATKVAGEISSTNPVGSGQVLSAALTENVWVRALASFNTTNSRDVWVDGANKASGSGIFTPVSLSQWILSGRPGDHTQNIGGLAAQVWMCRGVLLDDVEKQFLGKGGHPFGTACTDYWKLNRVSGTSIPNEYSGGLPLTVTGTFTLGADDPNSATWYTGNDIADQTWNQNQAIASIAVSTAFDNVNSAFTLQLMKINTAVASTSATTNAGSNARVVALTDVSNINPGDYIKIGTNAQVRVNDVIVVSGVTGKVLIRNKQTWATSASVNIYKVATATVAGVTFGNSISGTPTGTQASTAGYFMRTTCTADSTNLRLQQDSNTFAITVVAIPVAPQWSTLPAIATQQTDGVTASFSPNTTCTAYVLALAAGSAQPTSATIKAQSSGLAHASKGVVAADQLTLTGIDFPIFDLWFVLNNNLGDSSVVSILGVSKLPAAGKTYRKFTSIDSGTRYAGNCSIGDIEETELQVVPSNATVTYYLDGNESFTASGRQMRTSRVYSVTNKAWILDDAGQIVANVWYNDVAPVFTGVGAYFVMKLNTPISIDIRNLWTSIDQLVITALDPLPSGLTVQNGVITGQVAVNSAKNYSFLASDAASVATPGVIGLIAGTIKAPKVLFLYILDAEAVLSNDHILWKITEQEDDGPPGIVLGQDPAYLTDMTPGDTMQLIVSKTPKGKPPYYGLRNHSFQVVPKTNGDLDLGDPTGV